MLNWTPKNKKLSELNAFEANPRIIKGKPFEDLKASIDKFGLVVPIVINTDGTIIGGHARFHALNERGEEFATVFEPDRTLDEKEVKELNIRLNRIAGQWDFEKLGNEFDMNDLKDWGFEEHEFGNFDFGDESEQGKLDEKTVEKLLTCPECGHTWEYQKKIKTSK